LIRERAVGRRVNWARKVSHRLAREWTATAHPFSSWSLSCSLATLRAKAFPTLATNQGVNLLCREGNSQPGHWMPAKRHLGAKGALASLAGNTFTTFSRIPKKCPREERDELRYAASRCYGNFSKTSLQLGENQVKEEIEKEAVIIKIQKTLTAFLFSFFFLVFTSRWLQRSV